MRTRIVLFTLLVSLSLAGRSLAQENAVPPNAGAENAAPIAAEVDALLMPENIAELEKGNVVSGSTKVKNAEGKSRARGHAMILINRPFDPIWEQFSRYEEYPEFFPHLASCEMLAKKENQIWLRETVKAMLMTFRYHVIHTVDKEHGTISWCLDRSKPNDIADTTGSWVIRRHGEKACFAIYIVSVESGMFLPGVIEDFFQYQSLKGVVKAIKKRMESRPE